MSTSLPLPLPLPLSVSLSHSISLPLAWPCCEIHFRQPCRVACGGFSLFELPLPTVFVVALPPANFTTPCHTRQAGDQLNAQLPPVSFRHSICHPPLPLSLCPLCLLSLSLSLFHLLLSSILHKLFRIYFGLPVRPVTYGLAAAPYSPPGSAPSLALPLSLSRTYQGCL